MADLCLTQVHPVLLYDNGNVMSKTTLWDKPFAQQVFSWKSSSQGFMDR